MGRKCINFYSYVGQLQHFALTAPKRILWEIPLQAVELFTDIKNMTVSVFNVLVSLLLLFILPLSVLIVPIISPLLAALGLWVKRRAIIYQAEVERRADELHRGANHE